MIVKDEHELHTRRRGRNFALGGALALFVLIVFAVTIVKLANGQVIQAY